jgi:hypothetical protein
MPKRPPCPGDAQDYVWVESREKPHWRRKRGSIVQARLNSAFQVASERTGIVSPVAKRVRKALGPYMRGLDAGRLNNRICNAFRKALKDRGKMTLSCLKGLEMQRKLPLDCMLQCDYSFQVLEKRLRIEIPVNWSSVKPLNPLVTDYYFEAVLLYGDVNKERGLETDSVESPLYPMYTNSESVCVLELERPEEDWCVLLKINSHEGNEMAVHPKHYRMKVIGVCGDENLPLNSRRVEVVTSLYGARRGGSESAGEREC